MKVGARVILFNARMRERRKELGYTQKDLSEISGANISFIGQVELLQPLRPSGTTRKHLNAIALALDCEFDYIFPEDYIDAMAANILPGLRNMVFVKDISLNELPPSSESLLLPSAEEIAFDNIRRETVEELLDRLESRERRVIELIYGLCGNEKHTFEMVAKKLGVTRERIRQIENMALSKLRHPLIRRRLEDFPHGRGGPVYPWAKKVTTSPPPE